MKQSLKNNNSVNSINTISQTGSNQVRVTQTTSNNSIKPSSGGKKKIGWFKILTTILIPILAIVIPIILSMQKQEINNTDSPGSINTINQVGDNTIINNNKRVIQSAEKQKYSAGEKYILKITMQQTDGIWDNGTPFWLQLDLTGPYTRYAFLSGYPPTLPLFNSTTTKHSIKAANAGYIELKTTTPPLNEPIIIEIESDVDIDLKDIRVSPT